MGVTSRCFHKPGAGQTPGYGHDLVINYADGKLLCPKHSFTNYRYGPYHHLFDLSRRVGLLRPVAEVQRVHMVQRATLFRPRVAPPAIPAVNPAPLLDEHDMVRMRHASTRTRR